jgi:hypothetical protein
MNGPHKSERCNKVTAPALETTCSVFVTDAAVHNDEHERGCQDKEDELED